VTGEVMGLRELSGRLQTPKRRAAANTQASNFTISIRRLESGSEWKEEGLGKGAKGGAFLDMTDKGSLSRFVNHSSVSTRPKPSTLQTLSFHFISFVFPLISSFSWSALKLYRPQTFISFPFLFCSFLPFLVARIVRPPTVAARPQIR